ncbi:MAG: hypothetical protein IPK67_05390 [Planctomycetes bacterium]|nr:hypothetical protein [Planctomycetota bacterium]
MLHRTLLACSTLLAAAGVSSAQEFSFQVSSAQSSVDIGSNLSQALPGSVLGDYDAVNNPGGTRTLPGLFGGSGNQPVPMDITFQTQLAVQEHPTGGFGASIDLNTSTIVVSGFQFDALGGQTAQANLTLQLLYQSFRTFAPNSVFLGGVPLPLPLGQASVAGLTFVQNGPGAGVLVADPLLANTYSTTILLPVDVSFTVDLLGNVTPVGPLPILLPLNGTLLMGQGTATLSFTGQQSTNQKIPDPLPGQTIDSFPLAVPTILPPGGTANLLFSAVFGSLSFDLSTGIQLVADGSALCLTDRICSVARNSSGLPARIDLVGSLSVSTNNLAVRTTNLPPSRVSVVVFGDSPKGVPFYAGTLCVGGTVYRLAPVQADPFGTALSPVDFSLPSPKFQALRPGSVWYFQTLYRDPSFVGPPANSSEALRVQFCP